MAEPEKRRRRPAVSCTLCRKRKLRCDREKPCQNCQRSKTGVCEYDNPPPPAPASGSSGRKRRVVPVPDPLSPVSAQNQNQSLGQSTFPGHSQSVSVADRDAEGGGSTTPITGTTLVESHVSQAPIVEAMRSRIKALEDQLSQLTARNDQAGPDSDTRPGIEILDAGLTDILCVQHTSSLSGQTRHTVSHKNRWFGQSHWINSVVLIRDVIEAMRPSICLPSSPTVRNLSRCKVLGRLIKSQRSPSWPYTGSAELPSKTVADDLVECYLTTTETVYRVLHIPTFRSEYESFWASDSPTEPDDPAFLILLKLVLSLGALTYDRNCSMRVPAISWIYEALMYVSAPKFKARLNLRFLQINILLLLAREFVANNIEAPWIAAGGLLRTAMFMGLHRDPGQTPSSYTAEMRRRIWNTILELVLQASLGMGGPPLISVEDFNTQPPGNFDDEQLISQGAVPKPDSEATQMTPALMLCKTFPLRLAIVKSLNDMNASGDYNEALRLDKELRARYKTAYEPIRNNRTSYGSPSNSSFALKFVDLLIHRYITAIHVPFFDLALRNDAKCAYSRKATVDAALKNWCIVYPASPIAGGDQQPDEYDNDSLVRLIKASTGFCRKVAFQALMLLCVEVRAQIREHQGMGPGPIRRDLLSVLEDGKVWSLRCIQAGEVNAKGHLLHCLLAAQIDALSRGVSEEEIPAILERTAEEASGVALKAFEELAGTGHNMEDAALPDDMDIGPMENMIDNFDFTMVDGMFADGSTDWLINDGSPLSW